MSAWGCALVAAAVAVVATGCSGDRGGSDASAGTASANTASAGTASATASPTAHPAAPASFFDDTETTMGEPMTEMLVLGGTDVVPGLYRVAEPVPGDGGASGLLFDTSCKYGVYEGTERGLDQLEHVGATDGGRPVLRIRDAQLAYTTNCGRWELVDEAAWLAQPDDAGVAVGDGTWVVGADMRPGVWRVSGTTDAEHGCIYQVDSTFEAAEAENVTVEFPQAFPVEYAFETGQRFLSDGCEDWEFVAP